jgi:DNA-binding CsgD family transcriptional regulator
MLDEAERGHGTVCLLRGVPGVGKTTLLSWAVDQASEFRVISTRCNEASRHHALSTLQAIVVPLEDHLDSLTPDHRQALRGMLGQVPSTADSRGLGAALVALLSELAEESPVLLILDDLHGADATSVEALLFAVRRLEYEPVLVLAAAREEVSSQAENLPVLAVVGLSPLDVAELLDGVVEREVADELTRSTGGNPLAIVEIVNRLSADQRTGRLPLPRVVPINQLLQEAFSVRTASLSPQEQMIILCAAADPQATKTELVRATANGQQVGADVESLCDRGFMVSVDAEHVEFTHPLVRSAVYLNASDDTRRQAHRYLAAVVGDSEVDRRARHLAAASVAPDEHAAESLVEAATSALLHGDARVAGDALMRAAEFSNRVSATARLTAAGAAYSQAGAIVQALDAFDLALAQTSDPLVRADILMSRAVPELFATGPATLQQRLVELGDQLRSLDPDRAAMAFGFAALVSFSCSRLDDAGALCRRVLEGPVSGESPVRALIANIATVAEAMTGDLRTSQARLLAIADQLARGPMPEEASLPILVACTLAWIGEWSAASRLLAALIDQAHRSGQVVGLSHMLAVRSDLCFRTGHWPAALADGAKSEELSREINQQAITCYALIMRGRVEAGLGRSAEASRRCQEAVELSSTYGCLSESVHSAVGFVELTAGRFPEAIAALELVRDISEREGLGLITATPWVADLVEAYLHTGRLEEARSIVNDLDDSFIQGDLPIALRSRCRGLLTEGASDEHFDLALAYHAKAKAPFETARTELVFGERLRREGRRKDAIEWFERACDGFARLGATPWLNRGNRELAACGRVRSVGETPFSDLTVQEIQVALIVAGGATSREAAAQLFLSPRTVEYHLHQLYRKLGIRSRAELAQRVSGDDASFEGRIRN